MSTIKDEEEFYQNLKNLSKTNCYIDFSPNNPMTHKISVIKSLVDWAFNL